MEVGLIYAGLFALLLLAAWPFARRAGRLLSAPAPWTDGYMTTAQAREALGQPRLTPEQVADLFDVPVQMVVPGTPAADERRRHLGTLPSHGPRPFDRCWPGTNAPKPGTPR